jgi:alkanesulfonate monooxygenase SsuD/methylene tetrahydromethanopterin reductase-like flavin-dependent oxidoreductase (luciferase family)
MRVGVTLPSMGHLSQPDNLIPAAKAAERLGYDTLWVADRLLYPRQAEDPISGHTGWLVAAGL